MFFLNATNPETIRATRTMMMGVGYKAQRLAASLLKPLTRRQTQSRPRPPAVRRGCASR